MKKIKLLLVADTYYPKVDGTLKFMEEFVKRCADDFEISLLVPDFGVQRKIPGVKEIIFITPSSILKISGYANMQLSWQNRCKIKQAIERADMTFIQGPGLISYLSMYYSAKYDKKTIFYVHTIVWELFSKFFPPVFNWLFHWTIKKISLHMYKRCDLIIVPYYDLQEYLELSGVTIPITVARLGVDINLFSPTKEKRDMKEKMGIDKDSFVIGYVGRISKEKNIEVLLDAVGRMGHKEVHLLLVGDGPVNEVKKCQAIRHCTVTGFVHNVQDYLKAMDVFVMPSSTETTSLATLEAMATGLPVIVSKVGFIKRYVIKGYNGLFFSKESAGMLAHKIQMVREDYKMRELLGAQARKTVAYSFSWERSINRIKRILKEV